jgi:hypothetical protein
MGKILFLLLVFTITIAGKVLLIHPRSLKNSFLFFSGPRRWPLAGILKAVSYLCRSDLSQFAVDLNGTYGKVVRSVNHYLRYRLIFSDS